MDRTSSILRAACGLSCAASLVIALGACDLKKKDDAATAAPAAPPPPAAPDPAAVAAPPPGAPVPPPAPAGGVSAPPSSSDWAQAANAEATNAGAAGCQVKQLREWIRVACGFDGRDSGPPVDIQISRQGKREAFKFASSGNISLVYPWEEGQDLEAVFVWQKQSRSFTSRWPQGTPAPPNVGAFSPPTNRVVDQCDRDSDCGRGRQCCSTSTGRGLCREAGRDVCRNDNLYTVCTTDAECRREQGTKKSVCQYSAKANNKICVWDADGSRKTKDDQGTKNPNPLIRR